MARRWETGVDWFGLGGQGLAPAPSATSPTRPRRWETGVDWFATKPPTPAERETAQQAYRAGERALYGEQAAPPPAPQPSFSDAELERRLEMVNMGIDPTVLDAQAKPPDDPISRGADAAWRSFAEAATLSAVKLHDRPFSERGTAEKVGSALGAAAGYGLAALPFTRIFSPIGAAVRGAAAARGIGALGQAVLGGAATEGAVGAAMGGIEAANLGEDAGGIARGALIGAGLGAVGGGLARGGSVGQGALLGGTLGAVGGAGYAAYQGEDMHGILKGALTGGLIGLPVGAAGGALKGRFIDAPRLRAAEAAAFEARAAESAAARAARAEARDAAVAAAEREAESLRGLPEFRAAETARDLTVEPLRLPPPADFVVGPAAPARQPVALLNRPLDFIAQPPPPEPPVAGLLPARSSATDFYAGPPPGGRAMPTFRSRGEMVDFLASVYPERPRAEIERLRPQELQGLLRQAAEERWMMPAFVRAREEATNTPYARDLRVLIDRYQGEARRISRDIRDAVRGVVDDMVAAQQLEREADDLFRRIREQGGLRPYKGGMMREEFRAIPKSLRARKGQGMTLDDMARTLGYESDNDLLRDIDRLARRGRPVPRRELEPAARARFERSEEGQRLAAELQGREELLRDLHGELEKEVANAPVQPVVEAAPRPLRGQRIQGKPATRQATVQPVERLTPQTVRPAQGTPEEALRAYATPPAPPAERVSTGDVIAGPPRNLTAFSQRVRAANRVRRLLETDPEAARRELVAALRADPGAITVFRRLGIEPSEDVLAGAGLRPGRPAAAPRATSPPPPTRQQTILGRTSADEGAQARVSAPPGGAQPPAGPSASPAAQAPASAPGTGQAGQAGGAVNLRELVGERVAGLFARNPRPTEATWQRARSFAKRIVNETFRFEPKVLEFPSFRNSLRLLKGAGGDAARQAIDDVARVLEGVSKEELPAFEALVVTRDLLATARQGLRVPRGLTVEELERAVQRLEASASPAVRRAVQAHDQLVRQVGEDLVRRGKLSQDSLRDAYFPHRVLEYARDLGEGPGFQQRTAPPRRGYTKQREGSLRDIDTDYIHTMTQHLSRVRLDNAIDDFVTKTAREYDALPSLTESERNALLAGGGRVGKRVEIDGKSYVLWQYTSRPFGGPVSSNRLIDTAAASLRDVQPGDVALLPEPIARRLERLRSREERTALSEAMTAATSLWKRITLDTLGVPFQLNNLVGDLQNLLREDPAAFRYLNRARKIAQNPSNPAFAEEVRLLREQRVMDSGFLSELNDLYRDPRLARFRETGWLEIAHKWNPVGIIERAGNVREQIPRIAKFLSDLERIRNGQQVVARAVDIRGLKPIEAAGKVAREFAVDYGGASDTINGLRGFLMPFVTFYAENAGNWARYVARNPGDLAVKVGIPYAAMMLWNWTQFPEIERDLPGWQRVIPHVNTGYKTPDGQPIVVFLQDAASQAAKLVGLDQTADLARQYMQGQMTISQALREQAKATALGPIKVAVQLINPMVKSPIEAATNFNALTWGRVVPERLVGTEEDMKRRVQHVVGNILTPVGRYIREESGDPLVAQLKSAIGVREGVPLPLSLIGGRAVRPGAGAREQLFEAEDEASSAQAQARYEVERAIIRELGRGEKGAIRDAIGRLRVPITMEQIENLVKSPRVQAEVVRERLRQTRDPAEQRRLRAAIEQLEKAEDVERFKRLPKATRSRVEPILRERLQSVGR